MAAGAWHAAPFSSSASFSIILGIQNSLDRHNYLLITANTLREKNSIELFKASIQVLSVSRHNLLAIKINKFIRLEWEMETNTNVYEHVRYLARKPNTTEERIDETHRNPFS